MECADNRHSPSGFRQIEPLLHEVDPQHLLQTQRMAATPRLRIVRLDQRHEPRPRHDRIRLTEAPLARPVDRRRPEREPRSLLALAVGVGLGPVADAFPGRLP